MSALTIICPNARRVQVKTSPMMLLRQVLEEACLKSGFEVACHQLQTQNKKSVDLSLPFRLSGISNNATLEMTKAVVRQDSGVEVALQNPEGARHLLKVPANTSLFDLLKLFSSQFEEDLTSKVGNTVPAVVYMNKRYTGDADLSSNSLSSLGILSGKCLIRYMRITLTEELVNHMNNQQKEEAEKKAAAAATFAKLKAENEERERLERLRQEEFEKEKDERELREKELLRSILPETSDQQPMDTSDFQAPVQRDILQEVPQRNPNDWSFDGPAFSRSAPQNNMRAEELNNLLERFDNSLGSSGIQTENEQEVEAMMNALADGGRIGVSQIRARAVAMQEQEAQKEEKVVVGPCDRQAVFFSKFSRPKAEAMEVGEEFFNIQVSDVKSLQQDLRKAVRDQTQAGFVSKQLVNRKNRELKLKAYRHSVIRLNIGDYVLQACFNSAEPSSRLDEFVKSVLSNDQLRNNVKYLFANQKVVTSEEKDFIELELAPKSTIVAGFGTNSVNAAEILTNVRETNCDEADSISSSWLAANTTFVPFNSTVQEDRNNKRPTANNSPSSNYLSNGPPAKSAMPKWMGKK